MWKAIITAHPTRVVVEVIRPDGVTVGVYSCGVSELYSREQLVAYYAALYGHFDVVQVVEA